MTQPFEKELLGLDWVRTENSFQNKEIRVAWAQVGLG